VSIRTNAENTVAAMAVAALENLPKGDFYPRQPPGEIRHSRHLPEEGVYSRHFK
jgi:hypothetical protein